MSSSSYKYYFGVPSLSMSKNALHYGAGILDIHQKLSSTFNDELQQFYFWLVIWYTEIYISLFLKVQYLKKCCIVMNSWLLWNVWFE